MSFSKLPLGLRGVRVEMGKNEILEVNLVVRD